MADTYQFRHPCLEGEKGREESGKVIRIGMTRMRPDVREAFEADMAKLRLERPRVKKPEQCPAGICKEAYKAWFKPLCGEKWLDHWNRYDATPFNLKTALMQTAGKMSEVEARLGDLRESLEKHRKIIFERLGRLQRGRRASPITREESPTLLERNASVQFDYFKLVECIEALQESEKRREEFRAGKRKYLVRPSDAS